MPFARFLPKPVFIIVGNSADIRFHIGISMKRFPNPCATLLLQARNKDINGKRPRNANIRRILDKAPRHIMARQRK